MGRFYVIFRKPSRKKLGCHLFRLGVPKGLFRYLEILAGSGKKDGFQQERMFGLVSEIPIANTVNGLVEMDFVDCGDYAAFLHIRDSFSRF